MVMQMQAAYLKEKGRRGIDHVWSASDDALLKSFIDRYSNNWALISECFNASRLTISTDKRTPRDCLERWKEKWGPETRQRPADITPATAEDAPALHTSNQMTTRGVKRMANTGPTSIATANLVSGAEPKKRRRHMLIQDSIRKAAKKRAELAQKMIGEFQHIFCPHHN